MRSGCIALLVALAACGGSAPDAKAPLAPPAITVIDPGAEPRQIVRLELVAHAPEQLEITQKMIVRTELENTVLETGHRTRETPTTHTRGHATVENLTPAGDATVVFVLDDTSVDTDADPQAREMVEGRMKKLVGTRTTWHMAADGTISRLVNAFPASLPAAARARIEALHRAVQNTSVVFPDVPIGIGATWQIAGSERIGGIVWKWTRTCKLLSLVEGVATIDFEVASRADSQALATEPNASIRLTSAATTSSGQAIVPLHGLVPTVTKRTTSELHWRVVDRHTRITSTDKSESVFAINPVRPEQPSASN